MQYIPTSEIQKFGSKIIIIILKQCNNVATELKMNNTRRTYDTKSGPGALSIDLFCSFVSFFPSRVRCRIAEKPTYTKYTVSHFPQNGFSLVFPS